MPTLKWFPPQGHPRTFSIYKPMSTVGRALGNDVAVSSPGLADTHAQIIFDGRDFNLEEVDKQGEILINAKKKRRARLVHGDRLTLGDAEFAFSIFDEPPAPRQATPSDVSISQSTTGTDIAATMQLSGVRKLHEFSEKLMTLKDIDALLEAMLDTVIEVTGAEKGLILLMDDAFSSMEERVPSSTGAKPVIRASRHVKREAITDPSGTISDSIVRRVLETGRPLIVSDALTDAQFGSSESVVALRLSSVMCAPLLSQGHVIGALYVGNDRVKGLFQRSQLDLLSIFAGQASLILQNAMLLSTLRADKEKLSAELKDKRFGEIIGVCSSMMEVFRKLQKVATTDISVLITGETGTGKELIAREVHRRSNRANGPFVVINCGAIPENLIESELFGHVKGAFTDAKADRLGCFELADGGTLFLDEIGTMPAQQQATLLRVLQTGELTPVGSSRPRQVDVRVLSATNVDIAREVRSGAFREDLLYRLNTVEIHLPPLRERAEDIVPLATHFLRAKAARYAKEIHGFSSGAVEALLAHRFPGNVRELEHVVERAVVLAEGAEIEVADLALARARSDGRDEAALERMTLAEAEAFLVRRAVERSGGSAARAAEALGLSRSAFYRRTQALGIKVQE